MGRFPSLGNECESESVESVDVVDTQDRIVRAVTRAEMRRDRLRHRAVFVAVLDGHGRLLVHRRASTKDVWPGWLDIAVGGVVTSGETYDEAVRRELAEEIGVVGVEPVALDGGRAQSYDDEVVSLMGRCYAVVTSGPFVFRDGEVSEAWWMSRAEFEDLRRSGRDPGGAEANETRTGEICTGEICTGEIRRAAFLPDSLALLLPLLPNW